MGASSRLRSFQFVPALKEAGIDAQIETLFDDRYLDQLYSGQPMPLTAKLLPLAARMKTMLSASGFDLVWLEKEALPFMPWWLEHLSGIRLPPMVVDYDDALFHRYDQHGSIVVRLLLKKKIERVMASAACVVAGNHYLADHAQRAGAGRVEIIPTVLDPQHYAPTPPKHGRFRIGWIGSPSTVRYIQEICPALLRAKRELGAEIVVVGARDSMLDALEPVYRDWSEESEAASISDFSVGIMPLPDTPWERGKCGYKLLQYMATGKPVVASPVGVNREIVIPGANGFLPPDPEDWYDAFAKLKDAPNLAAKMGKAGREQIEKTYNTHIAGKRIVRILNDLA